MPPRSRVQRRCEPAHLTQRRSEITCRRQRGAVRYPGSRAKAQGQGLRSFSTRSLPEEVLIAASHSSSVYAQHRKPTEERGEEPWSRDTAATCFVSARGEPCLAWNIGSKCLERRKLMQSLPLGPSAPGRNVGTITKKLGALISARRGCNSGVGGSWHPGRECGAGEARAARSAAPLHAVLTAPLPLSSWRKQPYLPSLH